MKLAFKVFIVTCCEGYLLKTSITKLMDTILQNLQDLSCKPLVQLTKVIEQYLRRLKSIAA
jgi:hypothetical protein